MIQKKMVTDKKSIRCEKTKVKKRIRQIIKK